MLSMSDLYLQKKIEVFLHINYKAVNFSGSYIYWQGLTLIQEVFIYFDQFSSYYNPTVCNYIQCDIIQQCNRMRHHVIKTWRKFMYTLLRKEVSLKRLNRMILTVQCFGKCKNIVTVNSDCQGFRKREGEVWKIGDF